MKHPHGTAQHCAAPQHHTSERLARCPRIWPASACGCLARRSMRARFRILFFVQSLPQISVACVCSWARYSYSSRPGDPRPGDLRPGDPRTGDPPKWTSFRKQSEVSENKDKQSFRRKKLSQACQFGIEEWPQEGSEHVCRNTSEHNRKRRQQQSVM